MAKQDTKSENYSISAEELKSKMEQHESFMIFDIGDKSRYEKEHIPGSAFAVCDEKTINNLVPKLPKDIDIVLVAEDENYIKEVASMARGMGLKTRYLKGGLSGWKWELTKNKGKYISANELKKSFDKAGIDNNLFLLDVREPEEFEQWNIEGSKNIPIGKIADKESLKQIPKDTEIVTICPYGNRSSMATYMLQRQGYNVKTLEGGLKAWSSAFEYTTKEFDVYNKNEENKKIKVIQIRRIGKGCLSYIIGSNNNKESIVIDPVFPIEDYIQIAKNELNSKISKVYDTHHHADHVSGTKALAEKINADFYLSSYENYSFKDYGQLKDGDRHYIIDSTIELTVIHTPGHTAGALSFLISNKLLFTGDTVLVDNVGRPDLRDKAKEFAEMLHDTLHNKILNLPEDMLIFPAHIEGTVKEEEMVTTSLANVRKKSKYLNLEKDEFIQKMVSITMPTPPQYKEIIEMNQGKKNILPLSEIQDLEMGPNRCGVSA
jgi:glyoxylase-like metal-dependent hydrolase (beta-lactamase superfamily II)/rhodanese-related sulfurtransferase